MLAVTPVVFLLLWCRFPAAWSSVLFIQVLAFLCMCFYTALPIPAEMGNLYKGLISNAACLTAAGVARTLKETWPRAQGRCSRVSPEINRSKITGKCPSPTHLQLFNGRSWKRSPKYPRQARPSTWAALARVHGCAGTQYIPLT